VTRLYQIQEAVRLRTEEVVSTHSGWPCRKGCDECCRRLASMPRVSRLEWQWIEAAVENLPAGTAELVRRRIADSARAERPVLCPLLDTASGACLVYAARPVACRAYGFYAERESVLGCGRIEAIAAQSPEIVWGNHAALEETLRQLGPARELFEWVE
jgi:Fe-S-cluster containining protein